MTPTPRLVPDRPSDTDKLVALEANLAERYRACEDTVTPSSILLAVLNAVADVNRAAAPPAEAPAHPSRGVVDEGVKEVSARKLTRLQDLVGPRHSCLCDEIIDAAIKALQAAALPAVPDEIDWEMVALALEYVAGDNTVTFSTTALRDHATRVRSFAAAPAQEANDHG